MEDLLADRPFPVQALTFLFVSRLETARRMEAFIFLSSLALFLMAIAAAR
jgi:hypothetical protein